MMLALKAGWPKARALRGQGTVNYILRRPAKVFRAEQLLGRILRDRPSVFADSAFNLQAVPHGHS